MDHSLLIYPVVKVEHETRRYSRFLKNTGARLLNMRLEKSQTHSYPAHTVNKFCMLLSVILFSGTAIGQQFLAKCCI